MGLGSAMAGGNPTREKRAKDDFYATPPDCTEALLLAEGRPRSELVWEPACGDGAICKILSAQRTPWVASDIKSRWDFTHHLKDFLEFDAAPQGARAIITNPPFGLAEMFIHHAYSLQIDYMALLLKSTFWHAAKRGRVWNKWIPSRIYAMTWRPDFRSLGSPTMECVWCVWDGRDNTRETTYRRLKKPYA